MSQSGVQGAHRRAEDTFRGPGSSPRPGATEAEWVALACWAPVGGPDFTWFRLRVTLGLCSQRVSRLALRQQAGPLSCARAGASPGLPLALLSAALLPPLPPASPRCLAGGCCFPVLIFKKVQQRYFLRQGLPADLVMSGIKPTLKTCLPRVVGF